MFGLQRIYLVLALSGAVPLVGEPTNSTSAASTDRPLTPDERAKARSRAEWAEKIRSECIEARRYVAGRVVDITPTGLVVESGYSVLLTPPFNQSWVVHGNATVQPDAPAPEGNHPDAVCRGQVYLTNTPRRPKLKPFDYVVIHAYPAGEETYRPVPGVEKTLRRYSASLENAVKFELERREK